MSQLNIPVKQRGDSLTHNEVNAMVEAINSKQDVGGPETPGADIREIVKVFSETELVQAAQGTKPLEIEYIVNNQIYKIFNYDGVSGVVKEMFNVNPLTAPVSSLQQQALNLKANQTEVSSISQKTTENSVKISQNTDNLVKLEDRVTIVENTQVTGASTLGDWNAETNTPTLTSSSGKPDGANYNITKGGTTTFTGRNFNSGQVWVEGDVIKSYNNQWYRIPNKVSKNSIGTPELQKSSVTSEILGTDVLAKNYPFQHEGTINATLKNAIKKVVLLNADPTKLYVLTTLRKNLTLNGVPGYWQIFIRGWNPVTNALDGTFADWTEINYVPKAQEEMIKIVGANNQIAYVFINWSQVNDGQNIQGANYNASGISKMCYEKSADPSIFELDSIPASRISPELSYRNFPFSSSATTSPDIKLAIKNIQILGSLPQGTLISLGAIRKNAGSTGLWQLGFYNVTTGSFGALLYNFSVNNYIPSSDEETLEINGTGIASGTKLFVTVNWTAFNDKKDQSSIPFSNSGLSRFVYIRQIPLSIPPEGIGVAELSKSILTRNYPFAPEVNPPTLLRAIKDVKIVGNTTPSVPLTVGVLCRNQTVSGIANTWQVRIYEYQNGAFGSLIYNFNTTNYNPSSLLEVLKINGTGTATGSVAYITIDWSSIADNTGVFSQNYNLGGLPLSVHLPSQSFSIPSNSVSDIELSTSVALKNYPFAPLTTINATLKSIISDIKIIGNINPNIPLTFGVFRKNALVNGVATWQLGIYDYTNSNFNSILFQYISTTAPSVGKERIEIQGQGIASGCTIFITVDWSIGNASIAFTSVVYSSGGLSPLVHSSPQVSQANLVPFVIPSTLYAIRSKSYQWFYFNTLILNSHIAEKRAARIQLSSTKVSDGTTPNPLPYSFWKDFGRLGMFTEDVNLKFDLRDNSNSQTGTITSTKDVLVKTYPNPSPRTISAMMFGDSYPDIQWYYELVDGVQVNKKGFMTLIKEALALEGITINWRGIRTSGGELGECRASWSEGTYWTRYVPLANRAPINDVGSNVNLHSPFLFSTDDTAQNASFNFAQYRTTYNIPPIELFIFFLGMNGGDGTRINQMITNIKLDLPDAKFIVCMVPGAEVRKSNNDSDSRQLGRMTQNQSYISKFDNRQNEKIFLCTTHLGFQREYGLRNENLLPTQFQNPSDSTIPTIINNIDHHPSPAGAQMLTYSIIQSILCNIQ